MKNTKNLLSTLLLILAVFSLLAVVFLYGKGVLQDRYSQKLLADLRPDTEETITPPESVEPETDNPTETNATEETADMSATESTDKFADMTETQSADETAETQETEPSVTLVENPYQESYLANSDMAGWLQIPGTIIDYPVMWTPGDENYYLYRAFDGSDNKNGCLLLDTDSSLDPLTTNLIIHGHNMRSGEMFGNLTDYEDREYYEAHKQIILYTEECQRNYEVVAVFRSQVYKKTDQVFKFYKFFQADTPEEFDDFYENIKALSLYDTGVTAEFGDHFITLSTCVYHVEQGRFVVVAKEAEPGDYYLPVSKQQ